MNNKNLNFTEEFIPEKDLSIIINNIMKQKADEILKIKLIIKILKNTKIVESKEKVNIEIFILKYLKENIKNINSYNFESYYNLIKDIYFSKNNNFNNRLFLPEFYKNNIEYRETITSMLDVIKKSKNDMLKFSIYIDYSVLYKKEDYKNFIAEQPNIFSSKMIIGKKNSYNFNVITFDFLRGKIPSNAMEDIFEKVYFELKDKKEDDFDKKDFVFLHFFNFLKEKCEDLSLNFLNKFPFININNDFEDSNDYTKKTIVSLLSYYNKGLDNAFLVYLEKQKILKNLNNINKNFIHNKKRI